MNKKKIEKIVAWCLWFLLPLNIITAVFLQNWIAVGGWLCSLSLFIKSEINKKVPEIRIEVPEVYANTILELSSMFGRTIPEEEENGFNFIEEGLKQEEKNNVG